ncbi:MAG: LolA family protein [Chthoniobacteraceae bacterium]
MIRHLRFTLLTLCALQVVTQAAPLPPAKAKALHDRFEERQKETRTWSADFVQTLNMRGMKKPVISEGTITYRAPDSLRIDFRKPAGEYVLAVGNRLFIQKAGKRLAEKSLSDDNAGKPIQSLLGLLQGRPAETEEQFVTAVSQESGAYVITLTKKEDGGGRLPRRITNIVAQDTMNIREVRVEMPSGGTLSYSFREIARNLPVSAAAFEVPERSGR